MMGRVLVVGGEVEAELVDLGLVEGEAALLLLLDFGIHYRD